jgi:phosphate starvation-inducible protein PhoH and related proteins
MTKRRVKKLDESLEIEEFSLGKSSAPVEKNPLHYKVNCKFKNEKQKQMYNTILNNRITFIKGSAGTGKTIISLLTALECLKRKNININQIILTTPIVEISSTKGLGALPGDLTEKTLNYYAHFYDNLNKIIGADAVKLLKSSGYIKETVLNFLRGSTFGQWDEKGKPVGSFCIFDEAQNCSIVEMKTFISRMGEDSKLIIMGDSDQVDLKLKNGEKCGLDDAWTRLSGLDGIGFVEFTEDDIVRDPFLIEVMKRYKG